MRTYPLFAIARSHDGQIWDPLSDADARALFDELARCWELVDGIADGVQPLHGRPFHPDTSPSDLVAEVIARLERGEIVELQVSCSRELHLKVIPRQYTAGALDFALGPEAPGVLTRA